jgi:hypothetical protein
MKVLTINGTNSLVQRVTTKDSTTQIRGSHPAPDFGDLTDQDFAEYLKAKNLNALKRVTLHNTQSYSERDLTDQEVIKLANQTSLLELAKKTAIARLENATFGKLRG